MSDRPRFIDELKRRKVVRVVLIYLAACFAAIEAADVVFPVLQLPEWALGFVIVLAGFGLPVAVALAWALDLTPDGVTRAQPSDEAAAMEAHIHGWFSARTVVLVVIMLAAGVSAGWVARSVSSGLPSNLNDKSIAVIPFDNLSSEEDNAFFAIGIQEEILTQLQKISELHVISRSSVMRYQPGPDRASMLTMGEELNARWIVEGSVARVGQEVRINVQLIESALDDHRWAEVYEGDLTVQGILSYQGQVARRVAESLKATIQPQEEARIDAVPTENAEAYDLYLRGIDYFGRRREADLRRALDVFGRAIAIDSSYALAYAGRALTYAVLPFYSDMPARETTTRGLAAAYQALALDSTVAEAHAALGDLRLHGEYDMEGAETALRQAIQLKPSYAQAYDWLAETLLAKGLVEEGLAAERRALELDPLSLRVNMGYGKHLMSSGQIDAAIAQLERTVLLDSTFAAAREALATSYLQAGRHEEAATTYRRYADLVGPEALVLEQVALAAGDPAARTLALRALDAIQQPSWRVSSYTIAGAYMQLGEQQKALDWLERAYNAGDVMLPFAFTSATFAPLRGDERFRALAAKLKVSRP
jgi:TolB-like protein/Flp pilus assembly protein TadD